MLAWTVVAATQLSVGGALTAGPEHIGLGAELTVRDTVLRAGVDLLGAKQNDASEAGARLRAGLGTDPASTLSFEVTPFLGFSAYAWTIGRQPSGFDNLSTSCPPYRKMTTSGGYYGAQAVTRLRAGSVTLGFGVAARRDFQPTHFEYPAGSCTDGFLFGKTKPYPGGHLDLAQSRLELSLHLTHDFWL
jgi:hypothetical protein